jgi:hypothetical protein
MTWEGAILAVLGCNFAVFVWDRWRYDVGISATASP